MIALGYYTGPDRNAGQSRQVMINGSLIITASTAQPIYVIVDDDTGKQWVYSAMPNTNSTSSISVSSPSASPTKCTVHIAMGGMLVDTSGPSPQPVSGTMTGNVVGSMAFSGSIDTADLDIDLSVRPVTIAVSQIDDQLNTNVTYITPQPATTGTTPAPPPKPTPQKKAARPR